MDKFLKNWSIEKLEKLATRNENWAKDENTSEDLKQKATHAAQLMRNELEKRK